jgi:hypothetical protein
MAIETRDQDTDHVRKVQIPVCYDAPMRVTIENERYSDGQNCTDMMTFVHAGPGMDEEGWILVDIHVEAFFGRIKGVTLLVEEPLTKQAPNTEAPTLSPPKSKAKAKKKAAKKTVE